MFERCWLSLHVSAVASLCWVVGLCLLFGNDLELLSINAGAGPWVWLGSWLALALVIALPRRPLACWRLGLGACSVLLAVVALLGLARRTPLGTQVGAVLLLLALACAALELELGDR